MCCLLKFIKLSIEHLSIRGRGFYRWLSAFCYFFADARRNPHLSLCNLQFHLTECELSEADRCHDVISMRGSSDCSASSVRIFMQILSAQQQGGEREVAMAKDGLFKKRRSSYYSKTTAALTSVCQGPKHCQDKNIYQYFSH